MRPALSRLACPLVVALALPFAALAAEATRVASSFEEGRPFGFFLDVGFERTEDRALLSREWYQSGGLTDVKELRYQKIDSRLLLDLHVGIFRDLELYAGLPIVFQQDRSWSFAPGTDESNTTLYQNCVNARGEACATPGMGTDRLVDMSSGQATFRGGLGDLTLGLAWAPLNQKKDQALPTWALRFQYTAPTAALANPGNPGSATMRGAVGDRSHRFTLNTALSRRLGLAEPYTVVQATIAVPGDGFFSNCDEPRAGLGRAENCLTGPWTRQETGSAPPQTGTFTLGTELIAFERPDVQQRVVFDFFTYVTYVSPGRYLNEMSDLLGKYLVSGDFVQLGAGAGFIGQAARYAQLKFNASFGYNSERFVTSELPGRDLDNSGTIDVTFRPDELNPSFDYRIDRTGRRFRISEQFIFRFMVVGTLAF
jgi:hypothetical protein